MEKEEERSVEAEPRLPRAAVEKIIAESITAPFICSREVKTALLSGCIAFVHKIATEANAICEREMRKTVTHDHVYGALKQLGFETYIEESHANYRAYMEQAKLRPSRQDKFKDSGLTYEELEQEQNELFKQAKILEARKKEEQKE